MSAEEIFNTVGAFTNLKGLKKKEKALKKYVEENPDDDEGHDYLEAVGEMIYECETQNKE